MKEGIFKYYTVTNSSSQTLTVIETHADSNDEKQLSGEVRYHPGYMDIDCKNVEYQIPWQMVKVVKVLKEQRLPF